MIELPHYNFYINDIGIVYYDGGVVANDGNFLYMAYLAWVAEGNTAEEWTTSSD